MYDSSPSSPMKVASTVEIASVVDPNPSPSSRVHRLSRIRPDAPDRKKQASKTARMSDRLYTIGGARPAIRRWPRCVGSGAGGAGSARDQAAPSGDTAGSDRGPGAGRDATAPAAASPPDSRRPS